MALIRKALTYGVGGIFLIALLLGTATAVVFAQVTANVSGGTLAAIWYSLDDLVEGWQAGKAVANTDPGNIGGVDPAKPDDEIVAPAPSEPPV